MCGEGVYIWNYYTLEVYEDTSFKDIWWGDPETGKQYGKPKSYCRPCNQISTKGKEAVARHKEACTRRRAGRLSLVDALREVEAAQQEVYSQVLLRYLGKDNDHPVE